MLMSENCMNLSDIYEVSSGKYVNSSSISKAKTTQKYRKRDDANKVIDKLRGKLKQFLILLTGMVCAIQSYILWAFCFRGYNTVEASQSIREIWAKYLTLLCETVWTKWSITHRFAMGSDSSPIENLLDGLGCSSIKGSIGEQSDE